MEYRYQLQNHQYDNNDDLIEPTYGSSDKRTVREDKHSTRADMC